MGIYFKIFIQILIQVGLLTFSIGFNKRVDKMRKINFPLQKQKKEGKTYSVRIGDKVYALTFFPLSASILLINPSLFLDKFGIGYMFILLLTFMVWAFVAFVIEHIPSEELSHWEKLYNKLNAFSGGWLFTSGFFLFTKWELLLK